jgi:hypothetical protein
VRVTLNLESIILEMTRCEKMNTGKPFSIASANTTAPSSMPSVRLEFTVFPPVRRVNLGEKTCYFFPNPPRQKNRDFVLVSAAIEIGLYLTNPISI